MKSFQELLLTDGKLDVAHRAMLMEDFRKGLEMNRRVIEGHHKEFQENLPPSKADEMGDIILGDVTQHVTHPAPSPSKPTIPWGQFAVAAGLLASGIGVPAGAAILASSLFKAIPAVTPIVSPPPAKNPPSTDRDMLSIDMFVDPPNTKTK